jgi:hypothetical protein
MTWTLRYRENCTGRERSKQCSSRDEALQHACTMRLYHAMLSIEGPNTRLDEAGISALLATGKYGPPGTALPCRQHHAA